MTRVYRAVYAFDSPRHKEWSYESYVYLPVPYEFRPRILFVSGEMTMHECMVGFDGCCISRLEHPDAAREEAHSSRGQAGTVEPTSKHGI